LPFICQRPFNYQVTKLHNYPIRIGLPTGILATDLGFKVTGFAAGTAIVNAVFAQADFIETLAQTAVFVAGAGSLRLIANHALKFPGHSGRLTRFGVSGNRTMVDGLAMEIGAAALRGRGKSCGTTGSWVSKLTYYGTVSFIDRAKRGC
jgi:hypothetical protein